MGKRIIFYLLIIFFFFGCDIVKTKFVIKGETLVLKREVSNNLLYKPCCLDQVYSYDSIGNKIFYKENVDYLIVDKSIRRTLNSRIPDYLNHKVSFDESSKFTWQAEPNRNPQLNIPFLLCVDYSTFDKGAIIMPDPHISDKLKENLSNKDTIKIVSIGTSVTAGAHTFSSYFKNDISDTYPELLAKGIDKIYGTTTVIKNISRGGSCLDYLLLNLDSIILEKPNIVIIEFGMNDHVWNSDVNSFIKNYELCLDEFQKEDIDIVLVGFFQQNIEWKQENDSLTKIYNDHLKRLCNRRCIYFADIYNCFGLIENKNIYQDLTGDYLHHPSTFGHVLYYKSIMPYFLKQPIFESELVNLLYK